MIRNPTYLSGSDSNEAGDVAGTLVYVLRWLDVDVKSSGGPAPPPGRRVHSL